MGGSRRSSGAEGATAGARAAFMSAVRRGDARAASSVYTDEARLVAPSAELIRGRRAIEAFWQAGVGAGLCGIELETIELAQVGRLAYEIGRYALRLRPADGGSVVDRGKYLLVHERQPDGSWLRAVEMFNPDAPPEARQQREEKEKR